MTVSKATPADDRTPVGAPTWALLIALVVVALGVRLAFCAFKTGLGRIDEGSYQEYVLAGSRLLAHGTLVSPLITGPIDPAPSALLPPGYAVLVAGVYRVLGVDTFASALTLQVINALATSLCVPLVFLMVRRWTGVGGRRLGDSAGWIAAGLTAVNPMLFGFTHLVWDTNLAAFGNVFTVYLAYQLGVRRRRASRFLLYGLWLGLLAMLNPALSAAYPFLVLWPITRAEGWRAKPLARNVGLVVAGWLIAIAPWTVRNYIHFDKLIYIRGGFMEELWLGVSPQADVNLETAFLHHFPLLNADVQERVAQIGEQAFLAECGEKARQAIAEDPRRWLGLVGRRAADFWAGTLFSLATADGMPRTMQRAAVTAFMLAETAVVLIATLYLRGRTRPEVWWLLAIAVSFSIVFCLTQVQVRFRALIDPVLTMAAVVQTVEAWRTWRDARNCELRTTDYKGP